MEEILKSGNTEEILKCLVEKLKNMRHNQRRFKRLGNPEILNTLEPLEKEIDDILNILTDTQLKLFQ